MKYKIFEYKDFLKIQVDPTQMHMVMHGVHDLNQVFDWKSAKLVETHKTCTPCITMCI